MLAWNGICRINILTFLKMRDNIIIEKGGNMLRFLKALLITVIVLLSVFALGILGLILGLVLHFCGWALYGLIFIGFIFLIVYASMGDEK